MIRPFTTSYPDRLHNLRNLFRKKAEGFLVMNIVNVRYLTGFTGSSGFVFITKKANIFVTDFRYKEQSAKEVIGWDIVMEKGERIQTIQKLIKKMHIKKLGFESSVTFEFFKKLLKTGIILNPLKGPIEKLRIIKDEQEIESIRKAVKRAEAAFLETKPYVRQGAQERSIALRLEENLKKKGCNRIPFDILVASGRNSAMPHAKPSEKRLQPGDLVIIDWGGEADGYYSDMTRTFLIKGGTPGNKKEIYHIVLEANRKALSQVSPNKYSGEIDNKAREIIKKAGYGEFFGHGTGHGLGLQIHESPRITWNTREKIRENMVFTIEPGIYIPDLGGVRIEDMVIVGEKRAAELTSLPKELEII
jgi:Xaa-Pro aminopeptidase